MGNRVKAIVIDALAREHGRRIVTIDVIGSGPRAVAGLLKAKGVKADIYPAEEVIEDPWILGNYDIMLVSAMTCDKPVARRLLRLWRKYSYGASIIGGPIAIEYKECLRMGYSYVVYGEGEVVLPKLLNCIQKEYECSDVKGLAYLRNDTVVFAETTILFFLPV